MRIPTAHYLRDESPPEAYFHWLCHLVHVNMEKYSYWLLAGDLHSKIFKCYVPHDDNRAIEGKMLRERFCLSDDCSIKSLKLGECTMLEMLIALAEQMDYMVSDIVQTSKTASLFWEMMANCGLNRYSDDDYNGLQVANILDKLVERTYRRNGDGGLFPLRCAKKDQRRVELWYQMCQYVLQNGYI